MTGHQIFETLGNVELLSQQKIALFASRSAPPPIYEPALALFQELIRLPLTLVGGWQAPLEKFLFKHSEAQQRANYIHYLSSNINQFKADDRQKELLQSDKLLVISPLLKEKRASRPSVKKRDELIFRQVKKILFLYVHPGGRLETYFRHLSEQDYLLYLLDDPLNQAFRHEDVITVSADNPAIILQT
jgi:hypothetical protein